jgi:hypothetical protein
MCFETLPTTFLLSPALNGEAGHILLGFSKLQIHLSGMEAREFLIPEKDERPRKIKREDMPSVAPHDASALGNADAKEEISFENSRSRSIKDVTSVAPRKYGCPMNQDSHS